MDGEGGVSTGRGEMMNRGTAQGRSLIISFTDTVKGRSLIYPLRTEHMMRIL